jgi:alpha-D-ribose 1-methylphosphonate 5-triphosphate diphosphatase
MDMQFLIHGGTSLVRDEEHSSEWNQADINLSGDRICRIGRLPNFAAGPDGMMFDATDLLVLPGIVDLHGDAFERQIQPRPQTVFAHDIALADTDRQLVANGITTACHGLTYSWEGGLRGRESALALMEQVALQRATAHADHRIHLRFENHNVDGLQDVLDWIAQGRIDFLAFNEHLPSIAAKAAQPEKLAAYAERARCTAEVFKARLRGAQAGSGAVTQVIETIAAACRAQGVAMASHDDETCFDRERYQDLDVVISEFPKTLDALFTAIALDNTVVMGAPNVLLGGSHCGGLAAAEAVRENMCHVLTSDYYYPSLLHAAFRLAHDGVCTLAHAWRLVSQNPADVLGLDDRGRIVDGGRADLVLVNALPGGGVRLIATIAAGKLAYCAEPHRLLTQHAYPLAA